MKTKLDKEVILEKILQNIDRTSNNLDTLKDPSGSLFDVSPFKSGRLRAKIANKLVKLPLKIANKSSAEYLLQNEINIMQNMQFIESLRSEIDALKSRK